LIKFEYDFLPWNYTSFPSSLKVVNDEYEARRTAWREIFRNLSVTPGATLTVKFNCKQQDVLYSTAHMSLRGWNGREWVWIGAIPPRAPTGTFPWEERSGSLTIPEGITMIRGSFGAGPGTIESPGLTWIDDLQVYLDNKLIYFNDFSNWNPYIGAGVGGVGVSVPTYLYTKNVSVAIGAGVLGSLIGAAIGVAIG